MDKTRKADIEFIFRMVYIVLNMFICINFIVLIEKHKDLKRENEIYKINNKQLLKDAEEMSKAVGNIGQSFMDCQYKLYEGQIYE